MNNSVVSKLFILMACLIYCLGITVETQAATGTLKIYYGLTTSYTPTNPGNWWACPPPTSLASATATGGGGTVSVGSTSYTSGTTYTGTNNNSANNQTVTISPTSGKKIAAITLVQYYTDCSTDTVSYPAIAGDGTGDTTFTVNVKKNKFSLLVVDFDNYTSYTLDYTIAADVVASPATSCNTTANITPLAKKGTNPSLVMPTGNTGQTFTIDNTNSSCQVDAINFSGSWDSTVWNSTTKQYTTPPITANTTFQIRYKGSTYTVTTQVDTSGDTTCGSVSPATQTYGFGSSQVFTVTLNPGCAVASFTDNGAAATLSASKTYSLSSISANHTLSVKFSRVTTSAGAAYCMVPPFMDGQNVLKPNVLVIFDTSGSMADNPYTSKTYSCTENSTLANCSNFSGYFENGKMYKLKSGTTNTYQVDTSTALNLSTKNSTGSKAGRGLSGNYLNYVNMHKVDILRWILVGGQVDPTKGAARSDTTSAMRVLSLDNNYYVEYGITNPTGLVHSISDKVNLGMMVFNDNDTGGLDNDGGVLVAEIGSSLDTVVAQMESNNTDPNGNTPLAESLYEALRYFQGSTSAYNSNDLSGNSGRMVQYNGTTTDSLSPHRVYAKPVKGSCQNNYILVVTDGAPTSDSVAAMTSSTIDTSLYNWLTAHSASTPWPTTQLGKLSYFIHNYDLANAASTWGKPADMSKLQAITVSTVFVSTTALDATGATTLQDAARFGSYAEDKTITLGNATNTAYGQTNANGLPDRYVEYNTTSPMITSGTPDPLNTRGYYESDDGATLAGQLKSYFDGILSNTASGTAAAVANNKSGQRGANLVQALFFPQFPTNTNVKWLGEVQGIWYYLDPIINYSAIFEDTNNNGTLNLKSDLLLPADPFDTNALWKAGAMLHKATAASRTIYTLLDSTASTPLTPVNLTSGTTNLFSTTNRAALKPLMNAGSLTDTQADTLIQYLRGIDTPVYRSRSLDYTYLRSENNTPATTGTLGATSGASATTSTGEGVWKLGDVINSTPIVQSAVPINGYLDVYSDTSYGKFLNTDDYKSRNIVYTGANDGMLHAFRLGTTVNDASVSGNVAKLTGTNLGTEEWAFIPHNALPYIQNQCAGDYCHQYLVDGAPLVIDASINLPTGCTASSYWDCDRVTSTTTSGTATAYNTAASSWRTVMIGSMGLGGASRDSSGTCNETISPDTNSANNTDCVKTPATGNGMSSYFALDVTNPLTPKHMWEFSDYSIAAAADKGLGLTTAGAVVVRINTAPNSKQKNGRWFAVMASGPTGTIDSSQRFFSGRSDQNLKIYIVDLNGGSTFTKCTSAGQSNCNYWVKDTGIPFAFANSINSAAIDLDRWNSGLDGNFSDSVMYVTYTKAALTHNSANPVGDFPSSTTAWTRGGVVRLVTNHDPDPFHWFTSPLIGETNCNTTTTSGCIGPITTSVAKIQDRNANSGSGCLWVFFGEGRYFFPGDERTVDRKIYGIQDPCYNQYSNTSNTPAAPLYTGDTYSMYAMGNSSTTCPAFDMSTLMDQSSNTPSNSLLSGKAGWYITLSTSGGTAGSERVVSDVTATYNGTVFFTTYTPNTDICTPGGVTSMWAVQYNSGAAPPASSMSGKAPIQTSSGGIKLIDLATSFTQRGNRKLNATLQPSGMAPKGRFPPLMSPKASKTILQIQEK